jgi:hypothetical protein
MKLPIIIEFNSGESETYMAQPPEWAKWEKATGKTISQAQDSIGMWDPSNSRIRDWNTDERVGNGRRRINSI